jgi:hypothetical protein
MTYRIRRSSSKQSEVLSLSGRFEAQDVNELKKLMNSEMREVVLDLRELKLANRDFIQFLSQCQAQGIRISNCPEYIREWILRLNKS